MKLTFLKSIIAVGMLCSILPAQAALVLGAGSNALIGGDLTDPENNASASSNVGYDAVFRASHENIFTNEGAFNVFDNTVGSGNAKWCCNGPGTQAQDLSQSNLRSVWVEADFGLDRYFLNVFTLASGNDVAGRDADQWRLLGSNDGINYSAIYTWDNNGRSVWSARNQVVEFSSAMGDFATQTTAYSIFRYEAYSTINQSLHQVNELELFGVRDVPEPAGIAVLGLAMLLLGSRKLKA